MADLSVIYRIAADITGLESGVAGAGKALGRLGTDAKKLGTAMLPISIAMTGIGVVALQSAIDFESSFAGIRKTVGDATDSLGNLTEVGKSLQQGMRDLAKEIPVSVGELNKIGEAAGQLGIESENILGFTRVMADLGVTTNLTSEQAATALARFANITQMPQENFDRLGSTIVALGNNLETTEAEIAEYGLRLAGAGKQIGLSEAEILAIGGALSSVGINAEAGGTAISKLMIDIAKSVDQGGERLEKFAEVAGVSAEEFAEQFRTNAAGALTSFITGLGNVEESGRTTLGVLEEMGFTEVRLRDALLRASGAGDLLANSIDIGTKAWDDNNALTKEAEQRYRTTSAQLQVLWNQFKDVAITLGDALLPVMKRFLTTVQGLIPYIEGAVNWFGRLSPEIQTGIIMVGGLVAALGPALIAFGAMAAAIGAAMPVIAGIGTVIAALVTGPLGLIVIAVGAVVTAWYNWDKIVEIAQNVYTGVKTWLVDKFQAIVDNIKAKVDAVTGFFRGMYDKVVGQSYVPDMVKGIATEFGKLNGVMVKPANAAASAVQGVFQKLVGNLGGILGDFGQAAAKWLDGLIGGLSARWAGALAGVSSLASGGSTKGAVANAGSAALTAGLGAYASGASIAGSVALGAATMGIGLAAVGVYKGITALMGQKTHMAINDMRDAWFAGRSVQDLGDQLGSKGVDPESARQMIERVFTANKTKEDFISAAGAIDNVLGLAAGGLVRQPTFALIGERGPEVVVPLDQMAGFGGSRELSLLHGEVAGLRGDITRILRLMPTVTIAAWKDAQTH